jgi:hypothetical protein
LSPFSVRIREEVLAAFPEWQAFSLEETYKGSTPYLIVTVLPPPEAQTDLPLRISTWDEEISVDFDYYHAHFDRWIPEKNDDRHKSALLFVRSVLEEKVAAASWWQEELCKLCAQLEPGATLQPPFNISYSRVRVRSWRGSLNADRSDA